MDITPTDLTSSQAGDGQLFTTAAVRVERNSDLVTIAVGSAKSGSAAPIPTVTSHGQTWNHIVRQAGAGSIGGEHRLDLFAVRGISGIDQIDIDYGIALSGNTESWLATSWSDTPGPSTSDAIRQFGGSNSIESGVPAKDYAIVDDFDGDERNVFVGWLMNNRGGAVPPGTGFTALTGIVTSNWNLSGEWIEGFPPWSPPPTAPEPDDGMIWWPGGSNNARAIVWVELGIIGEAPWLRQRQRDDEIRARSFGSNEPTSEQRSTRTSSRNRYQ